MNQSSPRTEGVFLLTALGLFVVITGCNPGTRGDTMASEASHGEAVLTEWHEVELVDELWEVGRMEGPDDQVLGRIADVVFIGHGLALSDAHANLIHWYDTSGMHLYSSGGSGGGPGEFRRVQSLDLLPDGTLVALDGGGRSIEFFSRNGDSVDHLLFPGAVEDMCIIDSTIVVLGVVEGSDLPLHLMDLADRSVTSIGSTDVPETDSPHRSAMVLGLLDGSIGCVADRIVYARSSDGSVRALNLDGTMLWEVELPSFTAIAYMDDGERGIRTSVPEGATEFHSFHSVTRFGQTVAAQIKRIDLRTRDVSFSAVFLDLATGRVLGKDDSLPMIMAVREDRIAIVREDPVPRLAVYSIALRQGSQEEEH